MTRIELLSEAIALHHEPRPTETPEGDEDAPKRSELEWWWREIADIEFIYRSELQATGPWQPRSITEPEIAMRMLKELLVDMDVEIRERDGGFDVSQLPFGPTENYPSFEQAVAEQYCRAFSIQVGRAEG